MPGTLYLVSTPIGNLDDITLRAIKVLKDCDSIASEDTRRTGQLLSHLQIKKNQTPYHDHNKERVAPRLVGDLVGGKSIALVTDAGTPGIADPAFYLTRMAVEENIEVVPIPGASAVLAALVASGLPTDRFIFENYPPVKAAKRLKFLESLKGEKRTIILYESPYRLTKLLHDMETVFGNIKIVIARELTKKFEETLRIRVSEALSRFENTKPKGEFTVLFNLKVQIQE